MIYLQEGHVVLPAGLGAPSSTTSTPATPKLQAKVTDSSTEIQTLLPDPGYDGLSSVMVLGVDRHIDSNIKPENIKSGVSILGVDGTLVQNLVHNQDKEITENGFFTYDAGFTGLESVTVKVPGPVLSKVTITKNGTYTPEAGVDGFSSVDVEVPEVLPVIKELEITPSVEEQVHTVPEGADGFGPVTVHAVDRHIDSNIKPENIKSGVSILGVAGTLEFKKQSKTVYPSTSKTTVSPDAEFDGLSSVIVNPVTHSIDSNIIPGNIKSGVSILGVAGTLEQKVEYNIDEPSIVITYLAEEDSFQVIEPIVTKYVKKMVVNGREYPVPADGMYSDDRGKLYEIAWYFDYNKYNTDKNYASNLGYKCLPAWAFAEDSIDYATVKSVVLGDVNVIENDSLPSAPISRYDLTISRQMKLIKDKFKGVSMLYITADVDEIQSANMLCALYLNGTISKLQSNTISYWSSTGTTGRINAPIVYIYGNTFPFGAVSTDLMNIIDINEGTIRLGQFGKSAPTWVNAVDTMILPRTLNVWNTLAFNDNMTLDKIVVFNDYVQNESLIEVVRESGTKQHNGTLFVPEGASGYDSWLTKLNTVGTWTIKYFKAVKTPEFKGSASGYYGYTDPNTGKHLFVDMN